MFDFMNLMNFGREITAQGEKWQTVLVLQNNYHLAIKSCAKLPAQCYIVQEDEVPKKSGKYKGMPNWRKLDKATEKTTYFSPDEHDEWLKQWEAKTGKCAECAGKGEVLARRSVADGTTYKPCPKCGGSGFVD